MNWQQKTRAQALILFVSIAAYACPGAPAQYTGGHNGQQQQQPQGQTSPAKIKDWFAKYDEVRREAQMNPDERQRADNLLSKGLSIIVPGEEKVATQNLLSSLVQRNGRAADQLKMLPVYPETKQLHLGYYKYFIDAKALFSDYLTVQGNLFAQDAQGKALASDLMPRKQALEQLDQSNKALDAEVRQKFGIAPYKYQL